MEILSRIFNEASSHHEYIKKNKKTFLFIINPFENELYIETLLTVVKWFDKLLRYCQWEEVALQFNLSSKPISFRSISKCNLLGKTLSMHLMIISNRFYQFQIYLNFVVRSYFIPCLIMLISFI